MKILSVITSGLLVSSLVVLAGCSADPEAVQEDILSELSTYTISLVNDLATETEFKGVSKDTVYQKVASKKADSFVFSGSMVVSYDGSNSETFTKGKSYTYVATNCNGNGKLTDSEDDNNIHIVNLSGAELGAGDVQIKEHNTSSPVLGTQYVNCAISSTDAFKNIVLSYDSMISIDSGAHFKAVQEIDPTFLPLGDKMKYSLVAYDDGNLSLLYFVKVESGDLQQTP